jgi:two-component system sensor histidine kinase UhpB
VTLAQDDDGVVLSVVDDGRGFDGVVVEGGGLRGIRERALIAGGTVAIKTARSGGVEVRLRVPAARSSAAECAESQVKRVGPPN